jgi:hypothetical protein
VTAKGRQFKGTVSLLDFFAQSLFRSSGVNLETMFQNAGERREISAKKHECLKYTVYKHFDIFVSEAPPVAGCVCAPISAWGVRGDRACLQHNTLPRYCINFYKI